MNFYCHGSGVPRLVLLHGVPGRQDHCGIKLKCGHYPWREKYCRREFFRLITKE